MFNFQLFALYSTYSFVITLGVKFAVANLLFVVYIFSQIYSIIYVSAKLTRTFKSTGKMLRIYLNINMDERLYQSVCIKSLHKLMFEAINLMVIVFRLKHFPWSCHSTIIKCRRVNCLLLIIIFGSTYNIEAH